MTQLITSRLWTCCSTMWSPHSHRKWYQLWIWYVAVGHARAARSRNQMPLPFHEQRAATIVADRPVVDLA